MDQNNELRQALDSLTSIAQPPLYAAALERLRAQFSHEIRIIPEDWGRLRTFNCYAFSLGVVNDARYEKLVAEYRNSALVNSEFVTGILESRELRELTAASSAQAGDVIVYFLGGRVKHAGRFFFNNRVIRSKWGPNEIHEHGLWEVPASYGDEIRAFTAPGPDRVLDLLELFLKRE
jgi:hypothetical protein